MSEVRTRYEIEGDVITRVRTESSKLSDGTETESTRRQRVRAADFWAQVQKELQVKTTVIPALPTGCGRIAAMAEKGEKLVVPVELPPAIRSLRGLFAGMGNEKLFKLSFPFIVLLQRFVGGRMDGVPYLYYRNEPILSGGDELFCSNLPNINSEGKLCWGGSSISSDQPLYGQIAQIWKAFWESCFNEDWMSQNFGPSKSLAGHPKSFPEWEQKTAADPAFILGIQWRPTGKTLTKRLEEMLG